MKVRFFLRYAHTDSSIGIDQSVVTFGDQATVDADAAASATGSASSVDGIAVGAAVITNGTGADAAASVGVLDSTITVGSDATIDIDEIGLADADAATINKQNQAVGLGTALVLVESILAICSLMRAAPEGLRHGHQCW